MGRLRNLEDEGESRSPGMVERGERGRQGESGEEEGALENPGRRV